MKISSRFLIALFSLTLAGFSYADDPSTGPTSDSSAAAQDGSAPTQGADATIQPAPAPDPTQGDQSTDQSTDQSVEAQQADE